MPGTEGFSYWIEQLLNFGPYALIVLIVLLVIPRQQRLLKETVLEDLEQKKFLRKTLLGCWVAAGLLLVYIVVNWSPGASYKVSLYDQPEGYQVNSQEACFYIAGGVAPDMSTFWRMAVLEEGSHVKRNKSYCFYTIDKRDEAGNWPKEYYVLKPEMFDGGELKLFADPENPLKLYQVKDGEKVVFKSAALTPASQSGGWMDAHAGEFEDNIVRALKSRDSNRRVYAWEQLRRMTMNELSNLLNYPNLPEIARAQIMDEIKKRQTNQ